MCTDVYEQSGITLLSHMIGVDSCTTPTLIAYTLIQSPLILQELLTSLKDTSFHSGSGCSLVQTGFTTYPAYAEPRTGPRSKGPNRGCSPVWFGSEPQSGNLDRTPASLAKTTTKLISPSGSSPFSKYKNGSGNSFQRSRNLALLGSLGRVGNLLNLSRSTS